MSVRTSILNALAPLILLGFGTVALAQTPSKGHIKSESASLGEGFVSGTVKVNGATLHYVRGGTGPAVVLVHGFPQELIERYASR